MAQNHVLPHLLVKGSFTGGRTRPTLESGFHWNLNKPFFGLWVESSLLALSPSLQTPGILCEVGSLGTPGLTALALGSLSTSGVFPGWSLNPSVPQCLELLGLNGTINRMCLAWCLAPSSVNTC